METKSKKKKFMNKFTIIFITALILVLAIVVGVKMTEKPKVKIETNQGDIVLELYPSEAPITVENFLTYVKEGFYDNTIFHRIIDGFMVQGGGIDSESGQEKQTHAPIKLESDNSLKNDRGTVAMARTSVPDSATSQFFINTVNNDFLNYEFRDEGYAVFAKVIEGMDVVDKISKVKTDASDQPFEDVVILKVSLI